MEREEVKRKIRGEFEDYKRDVLRHRNPEIVWDLCNRIAFYSCVMEYFEEEHVIPDEFVELAERLLHPIYTMWLVYLEDESLQFAKWEDIEGILRKMIRKEE